MSSQSNEVSALEDTTELNYMNLMEAEVRDNEDPDLEGKIAVYIPKLMYNNNYEEKPKETQHQDIDTSKLINSDDFATETLTTETSNYIWVRPLQIFEDNEETWKHEDEDYIGYKKRNGIVTPYKFSRHNSGTLRVPRIGTIVLVFFLDGDPQKGYYFPFTPTVEGNELDTVNADHPKTLGTKEGRAKTDTIRLYWDGMRIEADTKNHTIVIVARNGNRVKVFDEKIQIDGDLEVNGNTVMNGTLTVKQTILAYNSITTYTRAMANLDIMTMGVTLRSHIHGSTVPVTTPGML